MRKAAGSNEEAETQSSQSYGESCRSHIVTAAEMVASVVTGAPPLVIEAEPDGPTEPAQITSSDRSTPPQYQRHLMLDPEKIRQAQEWLAQIVQLVDSYVDVEIPEDDPMIEPELLGKDDDVKQRKATDISVEPGEPGEPELEGLGDPERKLLERLLCGEEIPRGEVNDLAREVRMSASALVGNINDYYYDEIGAQLLFFDEGKLVMDSADREYLRKMEE